MSSVEYSGVQKGLYGPMIIEVSRINSEFLVIQTLGNQILFADKQNPTVQIKRVPLPSPPAVTAAATTAAPATAIATAPIVYIYVYAYRHKAPALCIIYVYICVRSYGSHYII